MVYKSNKGFLVTCNCQGDEGISCLDGFLFTPIDDIIVLESISGDFYSKQRSLISIKNEVLDYAKKILYAKKNKYYLAKSIVITEKDLELLKRFSKALYKEVEKREKDVTIDKWSEDLINDNAKIRITRSYGIIYLELLIKPSIDTALRNRHFADLDVCVTKDILKSILED